MKNIQDWTRVWVAFPNEKEGSDQYDLIQYKLDEKNPLLMHKITILAPKIPTSDAFGQNPPEGFVYVRAKYNNEEMIFSLPEKSQGKVNTFANFHLHSILLNIHRHLLTDIYQAPLLFVILREYIRYLIHLEYKKSDKAINTKRIELFQSVIDELNDEALRNINLFKEKELFFHILQNIQAAYQNEIDLSNSFIKKVLINHFFMNLFPQYSKANDTEQHEILQSLEETSSFNPEEKECLVNSLKKLSKIKDELPEGEEIISWATEKLGSKEKETLSRICRPGSELIDTIHLNDEDRETLMRALNKDFLTRKDGENLTTLFRKLLVFDFGEFELLSSLKNTWEEKALSLVGGKKS